jgi:hypothetical protein
MAKLLIINGMYFSKLRDRDFLLGKIAERFGYELWLERGPVRLAVRGLVALWLTFPISNHGVNPG